MRDATVEGSGLISTSCAFATWTDIAQYMGVFALHFH